jgi:hypothetical protein
MVDTIEARRRARRVDVLAGLASSAAHRRRFSIHSLLAQASPRLKRFAFTAPSLLPVDSNTAHASILAVTTVVRAPSVVRALEERCFRARAAHVVHPDWVAASAEPLQAGAPGAANLAADHARIRIAPRIVAYGAPLSGVEHLDAAAPVALAALCQPDCRSTRRRRRRSGWWRS